MPKECWLAFGQGDSSAGGVGGFAEDLEGAAVSNASYHHVHGSVS